jgi:UDP-N-acetylmuramyl pentapeptide phosphotransferase/UDP-N-acetylglucosamine-1-phosphate transferase
MNLMDAVQGVYSLPALNAAVWGFAASFAICVLLVLTKRWHGALTLDHAEGVQKFHTVPTPRIGGVPILLGLIVAWCKAPLEIKELMTPILLAGLPAFIFGLLEDITKRVSVLMRLIATMISGLLAWWITDYSIGRVDIWGVDWLLQFTLISVLFTSFAVGGVANSINIIDGFNGLSSVASILIFLGFAVVAAEVGDKQLAGLSLILAACVWGFFWVNWPLGKIFLGDGGAYFVGFSLAWVAVMLIERNQSVSAFSALLLCIHPVTEVLFSMYRRQVRKEHPGMPDRLHFHSLVKRRYVARWCGHFSARARNSITGIAVGLMTIVPVIVVSQIYDSSILTQLACATFILSYITLYARMVKHYWCSPIYFLVTNQLAKKSLNSSRLGN